MRVALDLGVPVIEPAGKQARTASIGTRPSRSWPRTVLTSWCTWAYVSTANRLGTSTLPISLTLPMSLRMRSTIIRFSARSFSLAASSAASAASDSGVAPRARVPLIGRDSITPDGLTVRNCSGEALRSEISPMRSSDP